MIDSYTDLMTVSSPNIIVKGWYVVLTRKYLCVSGSLG